MNSDTVKANKYVDILGVGWKLVYFHSSSTILDPERGETKQTSIRKEIYNSVIAVILPEGTALRDMSYSILLVFGIVTGASSPDISAFPRAIVSLLWMMVT